MADVLTGLERRRAPRTSAPLFGVGDAAVVRPGTPVWVVAISRAGALVESPAPIRPGVRTEITLDAVDGCRQPIGVEVLRCWVARLEPVRYRAAMRFEHLVTQGSG